MNPTHAQFFRELRELCKRYKVGIGPDAWEGLRFSFPKAKLYSGNFTGKTRVVNGERFDTPQKEGEK